VPIRLGIELSPTACRIVEIERDRRLRPDSLETRLASFSVARRVDSEITAQLKDYRGRRATVVVWAPGADHRPVVVVNAPYGHMRTEARSAVRAAGRTADRMLADIAPAPIDSPVDQMDPFRRVVLVATAPTDEISAMLEPVVRAGIRIEHVLTPAAALVSLARTRRSLVLPAQSERRRVEGSESNGLARPDALEAYVALDESAGALAIIRNGLLVAATRLDWGFVDEVGGRRAVRPRQDVVSRLADDISAFLYEGGLDSERIQHVCVASGVPDLRSIAMLMMESFDVEVEPLDSLYGIQADSLPRTETECRDLVPLLRLAWAAAADDRPPLDLMRPRQWAMRQQNLSRAAVTAGMVVGLTLGWSIQGQVNADPAPAVRSVRAKPAVPVVLSAATLPALARPVTLSPPPPSLTPFEPEVAPEKPARPIFRVMKEPVVERAEPVVASKPQVPDNKSKIEVSRPAPMTSQPDATVESILYSSDRRLAIVDGRIVAVGDVIDGFRIVDITPTAVVVADGRGALSQLAAGRRAR
jgi:hypothetical protein